MSILMPEEKKSAGRKQEGHRRLHCDEIYTSTEVRLPGEGAWTVRTTGDQGSGILSSMSRANCFVVLPPDTGNIAAGETVDVQLFEGLI
jgi:molybdopterin biosynthesis enzyme